MGSLQKKKKREGLCQSLKCWFRRRLGWRWCKDGGGKVVVVGGLPQQRSGWAGGLLSGVGWWGLSGSLAGRDTMPCDWGRARVSERGQQRGEGGSRGVRWRPVWWGEKREQKWGGDMREVNEAGWAEEPEMIRWELSKCERGWLWSYRRK